MGKRFPRSIHLLNKTQIGTYDEKTWPVQIDRNTGLERDDWNYLYCKKRGIPCKDSHNWSVHDIVKEDQEE